MIPGMTETRKAAEEASFAVRSRDNGRIAQDGIKLGKCVTDQT